jgi:hypothetical protein
MSRLDVQTAMIITQAELRAKRPMQTYEEVVRQFMFELLPIPQVKGDRTEAIANAILGTKQRRWGPTPSPEVQVAVRNYVKEAGNLISFYLPWGSSKQENGEHLDIAEYMALRQLVCLRDELRRFGVEAQFHFRLEDITDLWLFQDQPRYDQVERYASDFSRLVQFTLGESGGFPVRESMLVSYKDVVDVATDLSRLIYRYLTAGDEDALARSGWTGGMDGAKLSHYLKLYETLGMTGDHRLYLARYMAGALTRRKLNYGAFPNRPFLSIRFSHPIPHDPIQRTQLFYRTIPERYTNLHRAPWLGRGYLSIDEHNRVRPKFAEKHDRPKLLKHVEHVGDVEVEAFYRLE